MTTRRGPKQSKAEKAEALVMRRIDNIAGDVLHYSAPRDANDRIRARFAEDGIDLASFDRTDIENACDVLGLPKAENFEEE